LAAALVWGDLALAENDPAMDLYYSANSLCSRRFYKLAVVEYKSFLSQYGNHAKAPLAKWGLAISLYNLGQLKEAEPLFKELAGNGAVAAQEQLHNLWGACLLEQKRFPEAEKAFNWSIKNAKDPASEQTANARTALIEAMFLQDKWAEVIAVADEAGKLAPNSPYTPQIRYQGAVARAKLKKYDEAASVLKEIIAAGKDAALVHRATFHLAECLRCSDKLAESAELYKTAATTQKGEFSEYAHYNYGMVLFLLEKYPESIAALTDFRKLYPSTTLSPEANLYIGRALIELKDYARADVFLRPLATGHNSPLMPAAVLWYARMHVRANNPTQAVNILKDVESRFAKDPLLPAMINELATAHMALRRHDQAAAAFVRAQSVAAGDEAMDFMRLQAFCLHRAGQYPQSLEVCEAFARKYPKSPRLSDVLFLKAENLLLLKKEPEALAAYDVFLKAEPKHKDALLAHLRRAQLHANLKKWAPAAENIEAVLAGDHKAAIFDQAWYLAGDYAFQAGDWDKAVKAFETFIAEKPQQPNIDAAMYALALAYEHVKQNDKALETLKDLIVDHYGQSISEKPGADKGFTKAGASKAGKSKTGRAKVPPRKQDAGPTYDYLQLARVTMGRLLYEAGRLDEAQAVLLDARNSYAALRQERDGDAEYYLGWIATKQDRQADAAKYFAELANYPKHAFATDATLQSAILQIRDGQLAPALGRLQELLKANPQHPKADQATYYIGLCYARLNKPGEALPYLKAVQAKYPASDRADEALCWQGRCEELDGPDPAARAAKASATYKTFIQKYPKSELLADVLVDLAKLEFEAKRYDQVIASMVGLVGEDFTRPMESPALRERALYLLGWSYSKTGKAALSAKAFEEMTKAQAGGGVMTASAAFLAGEARMQAKEYPAALEHFTKAVAAARPGTDDHASALIRRGECEALTDRWKESQASCAAFIRQYGNAKHKLLPRAEFGLGWALENQKDYARAIEAYRQVTAGKGKDALAARCQFQIGECLFASDKLDQAVKEFILVETTYAIPEWTARAILELGRVREAQDREDEAMDRYKEVIKRFPDTTAAGVAKTRLKALQ
jgi:TolA-binding protein